jgi:hypothetical protein
MSPNASRIGFKCDRNCVNLMTAIGLATEEETTIPGKQDYHLNQLPNLEVKST